MREGNLTDTQHNGTFCLRNTTITEKQTSRRSLESVARLGLYTENRARSEQQLGGKATIAQRISFLSMQERALATLHN